MDGPAFLGLLLAGFFTCAEPLGAVDVGIADDDEDDDDDDDAEDDDDDDATDVAAADGKDDVDDDEDDDEDDADEDDDVDTDAEANSADDAAAAAAAAADADAAVTLASASDTVAGRDSDAMAGCSCGALIIGTRLGEGGTLATRDVSTSPMRLSAVTVIWRIELRRLRRALKSFIYIFFERVILQDTLLYLWIWNNPVL